MSTGGGGGLDRVVVVNVIRAWTPRPRRPRRGLPLYVVVSVSCVVVVKLVFCCLFFFLLAKKDHVSLVVWRVPPPRVAS